MYFIIGLKARKLYIGTSMQCVTELINNVNIVTCYITRLIFNEEKHLVTASSNTIFHSSPSLSLFLLYVHVHYHYNKFMKALISSNLIMWTSIWIYMRHRFCHLVLFSILGDITWSIQITPGLVRNIWRFCGFFYDFNFSWHGKN